MGVWNGAQCEKWGVWKMRRVENKECGRVRNGAECGKCEESTIKYTPFPLRKKRCIISFSLQNRTLFFQALKERLQKGKQRKNETSETLLSITTSSPSVRSLKKRWIIAVFTI